MAILRTAALSIGLVGLTHGIAWACSCASVGELPGELTEDDLVVFAEVVSVQAPFTGCVMSSADEMTVQLDVIEGFHGASDGERITVTTARSGASCGVAFEAGETWLVHAFDGHVSLCGGSLQLNEGDEQLELIAERFE